MNPRLLASLPLLASLATASPATARPLMCQVSPLLGDLNGDCVVNNADLLIALGGALVADLDGDGLADGTDIGILTSVFGTTCGTRLIGDTNGDGVVNTPDALTLSSQFGTSDPISDFNRDGIVDNADYGMLKANWGATMGGRTYGDVNGDDIVNSSDMLSVLSAFGSTALSACEINGDGIVDEVEVGIVAARMNMRSGIELEGDLNGDDLVDSWDLDLMLSAQGTELAKADLNGDGNVGALDLSLVTGGWSLTGADDFAGDVDGNWVVDSVDLDLLLANFGGSWPQADVNSDGVVNTSDLLDVLAPFGTAQAHADGDIDGNCDVNATDVDLLLATMGAVWPPADVDASGGANGTSDLLSLDFGPVPNCP